MYTHTHTYVCMYVCIYVCMYIYTYTYIYIHAYTHARAHTHTHTHTHTGRHLAALPVDPRVAKMLIYGSVLHCLPSVLTIAAGMAYKDPWVMPLDKKLAADEARRRFAGRRELVQSLWPMLMSHRSSVNDID